MAPECSSGCVRVLQRRQIFIAQPSVRAAVLRRAIKFIKALIEDDRRNFPALDTSGSPSRLFYCVLTRYLSDVLRIYFTHFIINCNKFNKFHNLLIFIEYSFQFVICDYYRGCLNGRHLGNDTTVCHFFDNLIVW